MIRFRTVTAGVLLAGLLAGSAAFAQGPGGPGGRRGGAGGPGGLGLPVRQLNLNDAQRDQIRQIVDRVRTDNDARQRVRAAREAQRKAVETLPVNEGLIRSTTQELAAAQADAAIQQARVRAEVWSVLTPEQQAQATKVQADREARAKERRAAAEQRRQQRNNTNR